MTYPAESLKLTRRLSFSALMKNAARSLGLLVLLGGVLAVSYYYWQQRTKQEAQPPLRVEAPAREVPDEPRIRHPIQEAQRPAPAQEPEPFPALDESDAAMRRALMGLLGPESVQKFFHLDNMVRRVVVTVDNLPRKQIPMRYQPLKPVARKFLTSGAAEAVFIHPDNNRRYTPYVRLAEAVDSKKLVAAYVHFYTLFQQAYEELGYPSGYFNDRLVEVIDDLLAAPEVQAPVKLVRPKVMYQFADPDLEARSAGQKILIRMGRENAAVIKAKLQEIRYELTGQAPKRLGSPAASSRVPG